MAQKGTKFKTVFGAAKALKKLGVDYPTFKSGERKGEPKASLETLQELHDKYYVDLEASEVAALEENSRLADEVVNNTEEVVETKTEEVVTAPSPKSVISKEPKQEAPVFHRVHRYVNPMTWRLY